ncbi:MAG: RNA polymerase factor sigma-54 [Azovibrio sp.]
MKASLQLKLSQQLSLTPQLQQAIKLLQLSTLEMNQEVERYLLENPMLEREDEPAQESPGYNTNGSDEHVQEQPESYREEAREERVEGEADAPSASGMEEDRWAGDSGSYGAPGRDPNDEDSDPMEQQAATTSLRDHLTWQLGLTQFSDRDRSLIRFLIEGLDDDGYLSSPLEDLLETLPEEYEVSLEDLEIALLQLQSLDPTGIAARSPQECLALQLKSMPKDKVRDLALEVVQQHLELLAARDFAKIKKNTACDDQTLKAAHALIIGLNPRPGAQFAAVDTRYIIPDVIVRKIRGQWVANINPDAYPRLKINRLYADILSKQRRGEGGLSGQLQEARWLIKNIQQRFDTIARVSQVIVERQRQFFEHGEVAMRPLVLREVADIIGLHESTVSRVTSQKFMATPRGIFELKYFFGSHVATDTGGACSAIAIRALIKQLIGEEDGKKPLSDSQISEILGQQGIVVARRTVAKYREALNIPPVNLRKTL